MATVRPTTESIPELYATIKHRMRVFPVKFEGLSMTRNANATEDELGKAIRELFTVDRQATVVTRFGIGDLYNTIEDRFGARLEFAKKHFPDDWEKFYKLLRQFAWVAKKWPKDRRSDKKGWTYYVERKPGSVGKKDEPDNRAIVVELSHEEHMPDGRCVFVGKRGNRTYRMVPKVSSRFAYAQVPAGNGSQAVNEGHDEFAEESKE